ncbi:hypothetical protein KIN20_022709 [Parelaphostrongylus tenuis]|uniref:Uncharacterized protein n=1 Tax=Parelaphostrongylus tenuis TaxID=148309 RepID=A0AAD5QSG5_PARTN|nr:hypothetical protein KIN20_022709 [Parelaphostrongylus tenuis]
MGRRKLPSIPSYSSYSTTPLSYSAPPTSLSGTLGMPAHSILPLAVQTQTDSLRQRPLRAQTSSAPVYINASAPIPSTSTCYSPFTVSSTCTQTITNLSSFEKLPNGQLSADYARPSSVTSVTTSSPTRQHDPAIYPGASFKPTAKHKTALRQPVSVITTKASNAPKIPNTLARVLLKKELKEALSRRREALEACEIEANQRQYIVHKMLVTGLLPEAREDDIPKVTPCMLPIELISGARVMPKSVHTVATQKSDQDFRFPSSTSCHIQHKPHSTSSIISQESSPSVPVSRVQFKPSTSLRAQLDIERKPRHKDLSSARNVETQTEQHFPLDYSPSTRQKPTTSRGLSNRASRNNATVQTNDLLEATRKYFEDYDRQLNELAEKAKRSAQRKQFDFHDDDPLSREQRRLQLINELAQRRERMLAQVGLPSETIPYRSYQSQLALDSSGYSPTIPQYGSLPRIDYLSRSRRSPLSHDFTVRERLPTSSNSFYNYRSLPRNYERSLGQQAPIQVDYEQSFGARPITTGTTSRSMFDLHSDNIIDPRYRLPPTQVRSLNYLDQIGVDRMDPQIYSTQLRADPYFTSGVYPSDTNILTQPLNVRQDDMVSRYANYLNQQFQTGLLNQCDPYRSSYMPSSAPPVRYDSQPTEPYLTTTSSTYLPSYTYSEPVGVTNLPYGAPQVYSRNEIDYGARPPNYPLDYGNRLLQSTEFPRFEDSYSTSLYKTSNAHSGQVLPQTSQTVPNYMTSYSSYPSMTSSGLPYMGKNTVRTLSGNLMPSAYDAQYPREDALTRMYATVGRRRPATSGMPAYMQDDGAPSPSFFVNDR